MGWAINSFPAPCCNGHCPPLAQGSHKLLFEVNYIWGCSKVIKTFIVIQQASTKACKELNYQEVKIMLKRYLISLCLLSGDDGDAISLWGDGLFPQSTGRAAQRLQPQNPTTYQPTSYQPSITSLKHFLFGFRLQRSQPLVLNVCLFQDRPESMTCTCIGLQVLLSSTAIL